MRAFVIFSSILVLSAVHADVSHLAHQQYNTQYPQQPAYQYAQPKQPTYQPQYPTPAQDVSSSSYNGVVNSYVPPASGAVGPYARSPGAYSLERAQSYLIPPAEEQRQSHATAYQQQYAQTNLNQYSTGQTASVYNTAQTQASSQAQVQQRHYNQPSPQQLQPIVTKHFYVHAAPEDPEENEGPRYVQIGRPRKNYKVIFIKAPTYGSSSQIIPVLPPTEDKTIVYVLSKKPTFNQNIQLPEPPVTEPSKPDVFFIKYKTAEEAQQAQEKIQAAYETGQGGASDAQPNPNLFGHLVASVNNVNNAVAGGAAQGVSGAVQGINNAAAAGQSTFSTVQNVASTQLGTLFGRPNDAPQQQQQQHQHQQYQQYQQYQQQPAAHQQTYASSSH